MDKDTTDTPSSRALRLSFTLDFKAADHDVNRGAMAFRDAFQLWPNTLLASEPTLRRIDMIADKDHMADAEGETPEPGMHTPLGTFCAEEYELDLRIDPALSDRHFSLAWTGDPDGGGEDIPESDTELAAGVDAASKASIA